MSDTPNRDDLRHIREAARRKYEIAMGDARAAVVLCHAGKMSRERFREIGHECQYAAAAKYLICGDPDTDEEPRGIFDQRDD